MLHGPNPKPIKAKSHLGPKDTCPRPSGAITFLCQFGGPLLTLHGMPKRDFLAIPDLSKSELSWLFDHAEEMKSGRYRHRPLEGQTLAMVFAKSSTRTRVSFEVGAHQLGAQAVFL